MRESKRIWMGLCLATAIFLGGCNLPVQGERQPLATIQIFTPTATRVVPTATATNMPTPTPAPTPIPRVRVENGDRYLFAGDYESALREYEIAAQDGENPLLQAAARVGMARVFILTGENDRALRMLRQVVDGEPEAAVAAPANYFLGKVFYNLQRYEEASQAYERYLELRPGLIDAYVYELLGDATMADGKVESALEAYQTAADAPASGERSSVETKLAGAYLRNGDFESAQAIYQNVFDRTTNDFLKAQMLLLSGNAHAAAGETEEAQTAYLQAVQDYPLAFDSYTALVELVNAGAEVSQLDRGRVDYYVGEYSLALAALDRFVEGGTGDEEGLGEAHYYRGLSYRALGQYENAIGAWDEVITNYEGTRLFADAWEQKGFTQWAYLDDYEAAIETFTGFVEKYAAHERAPQFLDYAARTAERGEDLSQAASLWDRVTIEYPADIGVYRASFLAGITYYRMEQYAEAVITFQRALSQAGSREERSAALLWAGKAFKGQGDTLEAGTAWEQAAGSDPTGYYSERARELATGGTPFSAPMAYDFAFDRATEKEAAGVWVRTVFNLPENTEFNGLGPLEGDPRLVRGAELWELGEYDEARLEFEAVRSALQNDAEGSYRLGLYLIDLGLYRSGIIAVRQVLTLAGLDDAGTLTAPRYFNRLRFGPYFGEIIIPVAQENGFHPLFIFSLARQESLFEGFVRSSAGARGVMQIIPSTGKSIADRLDWPPQYKDEDLYRPLVSIVFGVDYLASQRDFFDGDLYPALAAYNGGPGNAQIWDNLAGGDPDLFLELVRFDETRRYIRAIYENYTLYHQLYDRSP